MNKIIAILAVVAMASASSMAALTMVDDFEGRTLGTIDGQGNWAAQKNSSAIGDHGYSNVVVVDGDKALQLTNRDAGGELDTVYTALFLDGQTITNQGTLYMRYKGDGANDCIMGLNDLLPGFSADAGYQGTTTYSGQGPLVRLSNDQNFRARADGSYLEVDQSLVSSTWYELWMLVDMPNDQCKYYICADDGMSLPTVVLNPNNNSEWWGFRNDTYDQLSSIKLFMGITGENERNVWIDTVAVDTGAWTLDCVADVPEPASLSVLVLGSLALLRRRRR